MTIFPLQSPSSDVAGVAENKLNPFGLLTRPRTREAELTGRGKEELIFRAIVVCLIAKRRPPLRAVFDVGVH
jgi:hypothetical protein